MKIPVMLNRTAVAGMMVFASACAYPNSAVTLGGEQQPSIYFRGAPVGSSAFVDGVESGLASSFDGKKAVLAVSPGKHVIEIRLGTSRIHRQEIYLGDSGELGINIE